MAICYMYMYIATRNVFYQIDINRRLNEFFLLASSYYGGGGLGNTQYMYLKLMSTCTTIP